MLIFVAVHILASVLATHFFSPTRLSTIFWPASGIAAAGVLLGGIKYLPLVILASCIASVLDGRSWQLNFVYAFSNGLETFMTWLLLLRIAKVDIFLGSARDYLKLIVIAGILVPIPGAIISATAIQLFAKTDQYFWHHAQTWWMGNSFGVILITPLILIWRTLPIGWFDRSKLIEISVGLILTVVSGLGLFHGDQASYGTYSRAFVGFIFVSWAAVRFGRHATLVVTAIIVMQSITGLYISLSMAMRGSSPADFVDTWLFLVTLSTVGMALATTFNERRMHMLRMSELLEAYRREEQRRRESDAALQRSNIDFQRLVETSVEGIWTIDGSGKTTFVNTRMAEMLGYTNAEMLSKSFFELMPAADREAGAQRLERRNNGIAEAHECRLIHKNGTTIWTFMNTNPILDASGKITGALAMVTDISEKKNAEDSLRESEDRYRKIVEGASDAIIVHQSGFLMFVNPAAVKLVGAKDAQSLIGQNALHFVHPDDHAAVFERLKLLTQPNSSVPPLKERFIRLDGSIVTTEVSATAINWNGRHATMVIVRKLAD